MSALLEVQHLHKNFKDFTAVSDLSFTVNKGDVYGFLGQNGAGKSTTLRMVLSLIRPTKGEILYNGDSVIDSDKQWLKNCGAVIEKPDLYKYLSAFDNLSIFARMSGVQISRKMLQDQLAIVGLQDRAKDKVKEYSQGMKQRLGIAIALVHNPSLVILDEPTNGLDPQGIADIRNLIIKLREEHNKTVIISSHLLNEIEQVATRMIIIHKGEKIVEGTVKELINPERSVMELNTTDNTKAYRLLKEANWSEQLEFREDGLKVVGNKNSVPQLIQFLQNASIDVLAIVPRHSLEDYFLNLTNARA